MASAPRTQGVEKNLTAPPRLVIKVVTDADTVPVQSVFKSPGFVSLNYVKRLMKVTLKTNNNKNFNLSRKWSSDPMAQRSQIKFSEGFGPDL